MLDDSQTQPMGLLTIPAAARWLGIHPRTVKRWIQSGELPVVFLTDRQRGKRVSVADLEAFVASRKVRP